MTWLQQSAANRRAVLFLIGLCVVAYVPAFLMIALGTLPYDFDVVGLFLPWRSFAAQSLWHGIIPLWNPHSFCGTPFLANGQSAVLYPPNIIYCLLPAQWAVVCDTLGHTIFMVLGLYLLARSLDLSPNASIVAAVCMGFGTDVSAHLGVGHITWHDGRAYLGWNLWAVLWLLRTGRLRYAVASALLLALQFAAGYPPVTLMTYEFCAGMALVWMFTRACRGRVDRGLRPFTWPRWPRAAAVHLALYGALGGVFILTLRECSRWSVHGSGLEFDDVVALSGTWKTFVRALAPRFFGGDCNWQWSMPGNPHEEAGYIGIVALALALVSPWAARRADASGRYRYPAPVVWLWVLLGAAGLLVLGINTPVYKLLFDHVYLMRLTRIPARWMEAWSLAVALLAAFTFDGLRSRAAALPNQPVTRPLLALLALLAAGGLATVVVIAWRVPAGSAFWMTTAQHYMPPALPALRLERASYLQQTALVSALTVSVVAVLGASLIARWSSSPVAARPRREYMVVALLTLDVMGFFWNAFQIVPMRDVAAHIDWATRFSDLAVPGDRWITHCRDERTVSQGVARGIDIFNGYDSLASRRFYNYAAQVEHDEFWAVIYQPARYSYLLRVAAVGACVDDVNARLPGVPEQGADPAAARSKVWQLTTLPLPWPRQYLTTDVRAIAGGKPQLAALEQLGAQGYSAAPPVVVDAGTFSLPMEASGEPPPGTVRVERRAINEVTLDVEAARRCILVQTDAFYPGWQAWCNGRRLPLHSANYLFRAVEVPAGHSRVSLVYNSNTYRFGLFMTLAGIAVLVNLLLVHRSRTT